MKFNRFCFCLIFVVICGQSNAQKSKTLAFGAGFQPLEYADILWMAFKGMTDSMANITTTKLQSGDFHRILRSPEVGLLNRCEIFIRQDSVVFLSLRGTVNQPLSWMANFFTGMIPANGTIILAANDTFHYQLATYPGATIHAGWTIGLGFMSHYFLPVLDSLLQKGYHNIIVTGHSQGGALSYLCTSYLHYKLGKKYPFMRLKTYASAAPKPGNLYYSYDFESITSNGYGFRVVNAADWVPESPVSVQGVHDFNAVNPVTNASKAIKKQPFSKRIVYLHIYNRMKNGNQSAIKRLVHHLGGNVKKMVKNTLSGLVLPPFVQSMNYTVAGSPIILMPDEEYSKQFIFDDKNIFIHHNYAAYQYLLRKQLNN